MRVVVDRDLCEGNALCMGIAPDVFQVGDDDQATVLVANPDPSRWDDMRKAAFVCPKQAIKLLEH